MMHDCMIYHEISVGSGNRNINFYEGMGEFCSSGLVSAGWRDGENPSEILDAMNQNI